MDKGQNSLETSSRHDLRTATQGNAVIFVAMLSAFVDAFSYSFVVSLAPDALERQFHVSKQDLSEQVALLYSTFSIAAVCGNIVVGALVSRNSRMTFVASAMALCGSAIWFACAKDLTSLLLARAIQGLASAGNWTASLAMLAEHYSPDELGLAVGKVFFCNSAGSRAGPFIGGLLYDWTDGVACPAFVLALLAGVDLLVRFCIAPSQQHQAQQSRKLGAQPLLTNPRIMCICSSVFVGSLLQSYFRPIVSIMLHKQDLNSTQIGLAFIAMALGNGLGSIVCGKLSQLWQMRSYSKAQLVVVGQVMVVASSVSIALSHNFLDINCLEVEVMSFFLLGAACAFFVTPNVARLSEEVKAFYMNASPAFGFLFSIFNFFFTTGDMVGPLVGGVMQAEFGLLIACAISAGLALCSLMITIAGELLPRKHAEDGAQSDSTRLGEALQKPEC